MEDTGVGIPADKQEHLFESFMQVDSSRLAEKQGSGLGLTIVKRLTDMMQGTLTLESRVGKGTVIHLSFSDVSVSARLAVGDHAEPGGTLDFNDFAPARLLVVDDNGTNRQLMAGMFEKTDHRLYFATNGKEALERLDEVKIDLVLLDIRMPVMDGRTALTEMRKQARFELLPVIAVSASTHPAEEGDLRNQFTGYIRKPFSRQTLHRELAQVLRRRSPQTQDSGEIVTIIPTPQPERAAEWRVLTIELRRLLETEWPLLRDSLAINETGAFGQKLRSLGQAAQCDPLTTYAGALITLAESYVITKLEGHLASFPDLITSIEVSSAHPVTA